MTIVVHASAEQETVSRVAATVARTGRAWSWADALRGLGLALSPPEARRKRRDQKGLVQPSPPPSPARAESSSDEDTRASNEDEARIRARPQLPSARRAYARQSSSEQSRGGPSSSGNVPAPPPVAKKRGKDAIEGATNSGEVPFKEPTLPQIGRSSRRGGVEGAADQLRERSAKLQDQINAVAAKVAPFEGFCWWCFCKCTGEAMRVASCTQKMPILHKPIALY